ncbi:MAG: non-hydrolyzing UDP-N-acetylglucosamine 2-epimerase [bacterium]|jgi:UDP-N-acetylglucosamine 2-epimerase (non-hydrolysing)
MVGRIKILSVFGTRPEAIKMAPVVKALIAEPEFDARVVVTAQHREMLDQVLELFAIRADHDLDVMQEAQSLTQITTRVLERLEDVLASEEPDMVLVHGDTTTTFAAALAAFYRQVAVGHVEAGLRTHEKYFPFPEELNRRLTASLADLHFAPTAAARANLLAEGINPGQIQVTGNTAIDALFHVVRPDYQFSDDRLSALDFERSRILVVEAHRRENLGRPLEQICRAVVTLVERHSDVEVVFPVHLNPRVQEPVSRILGGRPRVHLLQPLGYGDFANLLARAYLVLSDSGGIQEEAPSLGRPVLVLRSVTERPEAVAAGTVQVVGTEQEAVETAAERLLTDPSAYERMARATNPFGDGRAARRILTGLRHWFELQTEPPEELNQ